VTRKPCFLSYPPGYPYRSLISDQLSIIVDSTKVREELGWKPLVTFAEVIDKIISYFTKIRLNSCRKKPLFCGRL